MDEKKVKEILNIPVVKCQQCNKKSEVLNEVCISPYNLKDAETLPGQKYTTYYLYLCDHCIMMPPVKIYTREVYMKH